MRSVRWNQGIGGVLCLFFIASFCLSCGYSAKALLPDYIRKIYIPVFVNRTLQYNIEGQLTDAVIREFASEGKLLEGGYLSVVSSKDQADAELSGEIVKYLLEPTVIDAKGAVQEYRMRLLINIALKDLKKDGKSIWAENNKESKERIFWKVVPTSTARAQTEQETQEQAFKTLASSIVKRTIWGW